MGPNKRVNRKREERGVLFRRRSVTWHRQQMDEMKRRAFTAHEVKFRGVGLGRYMKFFSFSDGEISGKSILDVGAAQANFQAEAEMAGAMACCLFTRYSRETHKA